MSDHSQSPSDHGSISAAVSIPAALGQIHEQWQPHRLASVNDQDVKIAKVQGEFLWHAHPDSDELFLVISGELTIQLRDRDVLLRPLELFVVPAGVEHRPVTSEGVETAVVMVETKGTVNTGDAGGERTSPLRELG